MLENRYSFYCVYLVKFLSNEPSFLKTTSNQNLHSTQSQAWVPRNVLPSDDGSEPPKFQLKAK
jgi:hypothetical protein